MNSQTTFQTIQDEFSGDDAAMARRLLSLQQPPRPALLARARAVPSRPRPRTRPRLRLAWAAVAITLLLIGLALASPTIQAAVGNLLEIIGNVHLSVADLKPDTHDATIIEREVMSLEAARAAVPFEFSLPTAIPAGWTMDDQVALWQLEGWFDVEIEWSNPDHASIYLHLSQRADGSPAGRLVGLDSYQEIKLGGRPAVLVHGGWDYDTNQWAWLEVTTIIWTVGDVQYSVCTSGDGVPEAELIRMAESTP